ncbi:MAG: hypothetical protein AB9846_02390 [Tenuifilaceae bacterium]
MRLQVIATTVYLLIASSTYSQEKLFFLKATPVDDPYLYSDEIPAALLMYNKDSMKLMVAVNLATYENRVKDIRYYYESKRIVILKETKKKYVENLYIINSNKFDSLIYQPIICPKPYEYTGFKIFEKINEPFLCLECYNKDSEKSDLLKGINLVDYTEKEFFADDYKRIILSGTAYYIERSDYQNIYTEPTNGNIRIPVVRNINERPIFSLVLPDSLQLGRKEMLNIIINNKNQFVIYHSSTQYTANQIGSTTLIIYDYNKQKWYKQQVKGNYPSINSYGSWLVGVVYDYTGMNENTFNESPGKDERKMINSKNEFNAGTRFAYFHIYSPGTLYLFNTFTQKYIEWNTGQGDSEILFVEEDKVYYRVNDEIYKVPIIKGEKLGKSILLIKDIQNVDIHWGFISQ